MKQLIQFNVEDRKIFEDYLNHMSKQGYSFKEMDTFSVTFEKDNSKKYYYVDLYEKLPFHHIDYSKEDRQKQIELYEEMGCTIKYVFNHFMIYESNQKIEIHSDPIIEEELIKKTKKRLFGRYCTRDLILTSILLIIMFIVISSLENVPKAYYLPITGIFSISVIFIIINNIRIDSKFEKEFKDLKFRSITYLYILIMTIVLSYFPYMITRAFFDGILDYFIRFGGTLVLIIANTVLSKYDSNQQGKRNIYFILLLLVVYGFILIYK